MSSRLAILAGLLSGILVAALVLGGIFVLAPETPALVPTPSPVPSPSASPAAPSPSASASVDASASTSAGPSAADGLVVIAVDVKEDEGTVAAFADSLGSTLPMGLDTTGGASDTWDALALPVHFWIDADGIVRDGALGGIGPDIMVRGLESILPDVTVTP